MLDSEIKETIKSLKERINSCEDIEDSFLRKKALGSVPKIEKQIEEYTEKLKNNKIYRDSVDLETLTKEIEQIEIKLPTIKVHNMTSAYHYGIQKKQLDFLKEQRDLKIKENE